MADSYSNHAPGLSSPAEHVAAVTPDDATDLATFSRFLYVGVAGHVKVTTVGGDTVLLKNVVAGKFHPVRVSRVWQSTTTATDIVVAW